MIILEISQLSADEYIYNKDKIMVISTEHLVIFDYSHADMFEWSQNGFSGM